MRATRENRRSVNRPTMVTRRWETIEDGECKQSHVTNCTQPVMQINSIETCAYADILQTLFISFMLYCARETRTFDYNSKLMRRFYSCMHACLIPSWVFKFFNRLLVWCNWITFQQKLDPLRVTFAGLPSSYMNESVRADRAAFYLDSEQDLCLNKIYSR